MPYAFPPAAPTLSGDLLTISRFLEDPLRVQRRLRTYKDLRFVADQILTDRLKSQGGAVLYDMSEPFLTDRPVEQVSPGSEYPYANLATGTAGIAAIAKWGQKTFLSDEQISRKSYPMSEVDKQLKKVTNTVIKQVDTIAMAAIGTAITTEVAVGGGIAWTTVATAKPLTDILLGIQFLEDLNQGYVADTLVLTPTGYTYLMVNDAVQQMRKREAAENPVYTGKIETVAGLRIVKTPNMPTAASGRAWILDSTQLGGMADEIDGAPGYSKTDLNVEIQPIRKPGQDGWDLQGRRKTVPVVQEPVMRSQGCMPDERTSSPGDRGIRDREDYRSDQRQADRPGLLQGRHPAARGRPGERGQPGPQGVRRVARLRRRQGGRQAGDR